jgi:hypothetical protein
VATIANLSQLVIWTSGRTSGLIWELTHLLDNVPLEKLVIEIHSYEPPSAGEESAEAQDARISNIQKGWRDLVDSLGQVFPTALPRDVGEAVFLYFDRNFTPSLAYPVNRYWPKASAAQELLRTKEYQVSQLSCNQELLLAFGSFLVLLIVTIESVIFVANHTAV